MLRKYTKNNSDHFGDRNKIDLLVCLGGDGTIYFIYVFLKANII